MQLGIFAKTFSRPTLEETLDGVQAHGLTHVQFNFSCAGLPTLPEQIDERVCARIARAFRDRGLTMAAISGTYNMLQPRVGEPRSLESRLEVLASACRSLGTRIITLCTGTLDPENMWRWHPGNVSRDAWLTLVKAMKRVVAVGERYEVTLAFEPEVANVVNTSCKARRLLDEIGSPWLKVVIDPANLFRAGELPRMREILDEAFELLGPDIVLAHAKDLSRDGEAGNAPAGQGVLDYDYYLRLLAQHAYNGPLILHGLEESQVPGSISFLRRKLEGLCPD